MKVTGIVQAGHQVASGRSSNSPYDQGTIALQTPHFLALGLDIRAYFQGTLNISLAPFVYSLIRPAHSFKQVKWHPDYPWEDFSFAPCQLTYRNTTYPSLIYFPHPETKINHWQDPSIIELLAPKVDSIAYGDRVELEVNPKVIQIFKP
jgi:hypothetical protein